MRNKGVVLGSMLPPPDIERAPRATIHPWRSIRCAGLVVFPGLTGDFLVGETDLAVREVVAGEEATREVREHFRAHLVRRERDRGRQSDDLRDLLALERRNRGLDGHGRLSRTGATRLAVQ